MIGQMQNGFIPGAMSATPFTMMQPGMQQMMQPGMMPGFAAMPALDSTAMSWQAMPMAMTPFQAASPASGANCAMMQGMQMLFLMMMMKQLMDILEKLMGKKGKDSSGGAGGGFQNLMSGLSGNGGGAPGAAGASGATSASSTSYAGKKSLTGKELVDVLRQAGFSGEGLKMAWAIAMRESGGRPGAFNGNAGTGDKSYGLFQINMLGSMGPARLKQYGLKSNEDLLDPLTNAKVAFKMSKGGTDFGAWAVGPNAYRRSSSLDAAIARYLAEFPG